MIYIFKSKNNLVNLLAEKLNAELVDNFQKATDQDIVIFFQDIYLDDFLAYEKIAKENLDIAIKNNCKIIYLDTNLVFGLTEFTSVDEEHPHTPRSFSAKIREDVYKYIVTPSPSGDSLLPQEGGNFPPLNIRGGAKGGGVTIIRFPDILGRNCFYYFDDLFSGKSNFLKWPGLTHINHEFIFVDDLVDVVGAFVTPSPSGDSLLHQEGGNFPPLNIRGGAHRAEELSEYNISGQKFTVEQIAAEINEQTGIAVKINALSPAYLSIKSLFDPLYKNLFENNYLYKKPVFLNSEKYRKEFGDYKQTELKEIISKLT